MRRALRARFPGVPAALFAGRFLHRQYRRLAPVGPASPVAQEMVIPNPLGRTGPVAVAARYLAADTDSGLGGDFYAVHDTPHGIRLLFGDVRGKGPYAARSVAVILAAFRRLAEEAATLEEVVAGVESALENEQARQCGDEVQENFATAVALEVGSGGGTVRIINRGHPAPLIARSGTVLAVEPRVPRLPLGLDHLDPGSGTAETFHLPCDATLLLLTDGVTEARDAAGAFYDPAAPLRRANADTTPGMLLDLLFRDVHRHLGSDGRDDIALLAIRRLPGLPARRPHRPSPALEAA